MLRALRPTSVSRHSSAVSHSSAGLRPKQQLRHSKNEGLRSLFGDQDIALMEQT